jgi:hypothetical protein
MKTLQNPSRDASPRGGAAVAGVHHPLMSLRSAPVVAIALAAVLVTIWLAAGELRPHSLFADPVGVPALK